MVIFIGDIWSSAEIIISSEIAQKITRAYELSMCCSSLHDIFV